MQQECPAREGFDYGENDEPGDYGSFIFSCPNVQPVNFYDLCVTYIGDNEASDDGLLLKFRVDFVSSRRCGGMQSDANNMNSLLLFSINSLDDDPQGDRDKFFSETDGKTLTALGGSASLSDDKTSLRIELNNAKWVFTIASQVLTAVLTTPAPSHGIGSVLIPPIVSGSCDPLLFGVIEGSNDGKQITLIKFTVVTFNDTCVEETREQYAFYAPNVASVLRGCGCTIADKIIPRPELTTTQVASYAGLRLILSFLLFRSFDVNLLRRSFYNCFITTLGASDFAAYEPLFRENVYRRLFVC